MPRYLNFFAALLIAGLAAAQCNQPSPEASVTLDLPGKPFQALPSADGCTIFVSLVDGPKGIAVVARKNGAIKLGRVVRTEGAPAGMVLTHDGKLLIAAMHDRIAFLDPARSVVLGYLAEPVPPTGQIGAIYVNVTADDRYLFVSDEYARRITVINLEKRSIVGTIPVGGLPIALTFSPDQRFLYTTNESAAREWGWPADCSAENNPANGERHPQGAIVVIDVARARTDPATSVVAKVPAGCSAVRLALSPRGDVAYVTARNANAVLAFDTSKLAPIGKLAVGTAPVGVIVVDEGRKVIAANSNRFAAAPTDHSTLSVIDAKTLAVRGTVPTGAFPRELQVTADGQTLLLTNFASRTLQLIRVNSLP